MTDTFSGLGQVYSLWRSATIHTYYSIYKGQNIYGSKQFLIFFSFHFVLYFMIHAYLPTYLDVSFNLCSNSNNNKNEKTVKREIPNIIHIFQPQLKAQLYFNNLVRPLHCRSQNFNQLKLLLTDGLKLYILFVCVCAYTDRQQVCLYIFGKQEQVLLSVSY